MTTASGASADISSPRDASRLVLADTRAGQAVLDGGWWPRSWDASVEVPALVLALAQRYGRIRHVMLSSATWGSGDRRLAVGAGAVRMGWFASQDGALAIAITDRDDQLDLLVVPPAATAAAAETALARAADPANIMRAPDILAAAAAPGSAKRATGGNGDRRAAWDNEGGSTAPDVSADLAGAR
ncbi:DUF5994 family protein [Catellatospora methionotrophica]|uniref:DUF5994 family protein n=1 Tax=Catellatospora methionotrophica TaxID=121620 RepID=UPI0033DCBD1D